MTCILRRLTINPGPLFKLLWYRKGIHLPRVRFRSIDQKSDSEVIFGEPQLLRWSTAGVYQRAQDINPSYRIEGIPVTTRVTIVVHTTLCMFIESLQWPSISEVNVIGE